MEYFTPPSTQDCSVIRSRRTHHQSLPSIYSSLRSVKELDREGFCDPHDPCCLKRDPEVFLHESILRTQTRKQCVPKNPLHFEYTIVHRVKMKNILQMAAERQQNPDLTVEELEKLEEQVALATTSETVVRAKPAITSSKEYFAEHPEIAPPSPELINVEELKNALEGLTNVQLCHEIALNKDFKLVKPEKKPELELTLKRSGEVQNLQKEEPSISKEAEITLEAKDRYWKMVDHVLLTKSVKEAKNTLLDLMNTLKTILLATMLPHNLRLKLKIDKELDLRKISKEIDRESFDIAHYMDFILDTLSALCCPIHDEEILEIRNIEVPSRQIRECIDLMESMNLDMANFTISQSRKQVLQNCVTYERNNFASYIETVYRSGKDPLRITRNWIRRHTIPERTLAETMAHCFAELMMDTNEEIEIPETMCLDWFRFPQIRREIRRVTLIGGVVSNVYEYSHSLLLDSTTVGINDFENSQIASLKNLRLLSNLREEINGVISKDVIDDIQGSLYEALERCCDRVVAIVDEHLVKEVCEGIRPEEKEWIVGVIRGMADQTNSVRVELHNRIIEWFIDIAKEDGREKIQPPTHLNIIGPLIISPITEMMRVCMYNRAVFDILYREIMEGKCPPPSIYPPKQMEQKDSSTTIVLDANKFYGEDLSAPDKEEVSSFPLDEGIMGVVGKLKQFSGRTMVYRKSHIDPRLKPMYDLDGNFIVPPERQPDYKAKEMTPLEQKHFDEYLLAHEPTLEEDYNGVYVFSDVGDPDWMFGYTTEQLLKLMERENLINANKLRRIKERLYQEVLEQRVADNLPIFKKIWRQEVGTLQQEFCRLERIMNKGPTPVPEGASDEPSVKRVFPGACELKPQVKEEQPKFTKKGERIIFSRGLGSQFGESVKTEDKNEDPEGMDLERFEVYQIEEGDDDEVNERRSRRSSMHFDQSGKNFYSSGQKPETPMELLSRNISVNIERGKTTKLSVGGLRIHIQKSFENSLLNPSKDFRKPKPNPFVKNQRKKYPRMNYYPGSLQNDDTMFDLPQRLTKNDIFHGTQPIPLLLLPMFQQSSNRATQVKKRGPGGPQYTIPPMMTKSALMAKRRSFQFHMKDHPIPRKSATFGARDSLDSLQTVLGSLQDIDTRNVNVSRKSKGKSLVTPEDDIAPPPGPLEEEQEEKEEIKSGNNIFENAHDGGRKSVSKIRFEIPDAEPTKERDPLVQQKIRDRRPTSVRTTRFTVPEGAKEHDPNRAQKIQNRRPTSAIPKTLKVPRFSELPQTPRMNRRASVKIRERRLTPRLQSPMFAFFPQAVDGQDAAPLRNFPPIALNSKGESYQNGRNVPPNVGIFPSMLQANLSQKILKRSKAPEPNEVSQELKKTNGTPTAAPPPSGGADFRSSVQDLDQMKTMDDSQDDPGTGMMRIRKRHNIGRILTPPYSRNERSNSLAVLDFRSSLFYKRNKSTAAALNKVPDKDNKRLVKQF